MNDMPKMLITLGGILVVIGLLWQFVGKLPGDIFIKKGNTTFYFPIVTCILVSVVLSLIFYVIGKFK
ncbi:MULTISPECIES: DUF2905 domain-containing protein [Priestia]|uniref:DUF2905 domain-containing protein n=4 Tax=Priestia TaxID=2800373 RepID=D5DT34_PRIM1|nr:MULTISPECIES: DUF2905 domain-containing protein [Priestia]AVX10519.1 DUF2905 domain-containing protein [Bacillus sp. Y-01]MBK0007784.1 DUF2905 domain-containing protein [Bacillus sp. S35]MBZ5477861.1 DUF2905 domain-containing protein [Bacillus sp. T_4]MCF6798513.1 DUF2905 domain-containing protein [Bacillus sp. ET1]MCJ7984479.1 DUF2905 domain-containing protein [Priestia sp. OVL9]MCJ7990875.1 DUF2905 domain-containing protein [Priestia sp. OVS21]MDH6652345.1 hypothetical protein [Bacillus